jgi:hypothetical protein
MPPRRTLPFDEARRLVRKLRISNRDAWREYVKTHRAALSAQGIPTRPDVRYKDEGWKGWAVWLSAPRRPRNKFLLYEQFREWVLAQGLRSQAAYRRWYREHPDERHRLQLPSAPEQAYQQFSWRRLLGKRASGAGSQSREYAPFVQVRRAVRQLARTRG